MLPQRNTLALTKSTKTFDRICQPITMLLYCSAQKTGKTLNLSNFME